MVTVGGCSKIGSRPNCNRYSVQCATVPVGSCHTPLSRVPNLMVMDSYPQNGEPPKKGPGMSLQVEGRQLLT